MIFALLLAASAFHAVDAQPVQRLSASTCTAEPNFVSRERLPIEGEIFSFSGMVTAADLRPQDFTPFASVALLEAGGPEELSAVLSIQPATPRRYDVTLRRLINQELRERSIIGRLQAGGAVRFQLAVTENREMLFRIGDIVQRLPLRDFKPDAIVLGCSSGSFRFDNMVFSGGGAGQDRFQ